MNSFDMFSSTGSDPLFPNGFPSTTELEKQSLYEGISKETDTMVAIKPKKKFTEGNTILSLGEVVPNELFGMHIAEI